MWVRALGGFWFDFRCLVGRRRKKRENTYIYRFCFEIFRCHLVVPFGSLRNIKSNIGSESLYGCGYFRWNAQHPESIFLFWFTQSLAFLAGQSATNTHDSLVYVYKNHLNLLDVHCSFTFTDLRFNTKIHHTNTHTKCPTFSLWCVGVCVCVGRI